MNKINSSRRSFLKQSSLVALTAPFLHSTRLLIASDVADATSETREPFWKKMPIWRGFNLLEKFNGSNRPFREDDFQNISDFGFNFVRLPMDYRAWVLNDDKTKFNEKTLSEIDRAIDFGKKYGVHVQINFHRAPGYTVANPPEAPLIWKDKSVLELCALHWQTFAKRYSDVSSEHLSFNLFNEPANCTEEEYYDVVKVLAETIRRESPDRLIVCDGINWGTQPCRSLQKLHVAQATRGYAPMEISHYGASWVNSQSFPEPRWPFSSFNGLLPSPGKKEMSEGARTPLSIVGNFQENSKFVFRLDTVSNAAELVVSFDDKEAYRKRFVSKDGKGEWKEVVFVKQYGIYQNRYDLDVELDIPKGTRKITLANVDGDWASISSIKIVANGKEASSNGSSEWNAQKPTVLYYETQDDKATLKGGTYRDRQWLWDANIRPWKEVEETGVGVMVGEFGAHNVTPHDVVLNWMEDLLINWKKAGWGWALWNFRGSFGIADSNRSDVDYEDWKGLKLDRKMLELLQKY